MRRDHREQLTAFNLVSGILGMVLIATPWAFEIGDSAAGWSAVFSGALIMRLGFSAAVHFRVWKVRAAAAVGAWLLSAPWLLHWESLSRLTWAHVIVGLVVVGLAAAGLRIGTTDQTSLDLGRDGGARLC
jgi:hypothetical protein